MIQLWYLLIMICLSSCASTIEDLKEVGKKPALTAMDPPVMWAQNTDYNTPKNANSLWLPGSHDFLRDNKARRVGDILKVKVEIKNNANMKNETKTSRTNSENQGLTGFFGIKKNFAKYMPAAAPLLNTNANNSIDGLGQIDRKDDIKTEIAAMVKQILPNGCLVIQGSQEVRVNSEVRELTVAGIVRQEDISAENSVNSDQIAEARISYGGRGNLSRVQQPRYGTQLLDILLPW